MLSQILLRSHQDLSVSPHFTELTFSCSLQHQDKTMSSVSSSQVLDQSLITSRPFWAPFHHCDWSKMQLCDLPSQFLSHTPLIATPPPLASSIWFQNTDACLQSILKSTYSVLHYSTRTERFSWPWVSMEWCWVRYRIKALFSSTLEPLEPLVMGVLHVQFFIKSLAICV